MKRRFFLFCMLSVLSSLNMLAYDFESDGIYYTITGSNTVSVVSGDYAYDGDVTIPQAVGLSGKTYLVTAIGENAFKSTANLESVTLPEGLTSIGNQAFYQSGVKTVSLPSTLNSMGTRAFCECKNLTGIELPDALTDVNEYAFYRCSKLKTLSLGNQTVTIGTEAFRETAIETLTIPQTTTSIGEYAFSSIATLKTITINDAPVSIMAYAFYNCQNLENLNLGNSIIKISGTVVQSGVSGTQGAFSNCTNLTKITLPSSLQVLDKGAFRGCAKLRDVTLPQSLTTISSYVFADCAIEHLDLPQTLTVINEGAFSSCPIRDIVFPSELRSIGNNAFYGSSIQNLTIPNSVISIGDDAFANSKNLKTVVIENAPLTLGSSFNGCSSLEKVNLGTAVTEINGSHHYILGWAKGTFTNCTSLKDIVLPNSIKIIGGSAFMGCSNLENVTLPNALTIIEGSAFRNCYNLKEIGLPETIQYIGPYAFYGCKSLYKIDFPETLSTIDEYAFNGCIGISEIVIPTNVSKLGGYSFYGCNNLKSVIIDNAVVSIEDYVFYGCSSLSNVDLGRATYIGCGAFRFCNSLSSITIPNSVTSIGEDSDSRAFWGCNALTSVTIGNGLPKIPFGMFQDCGKLNEIIFVEGSRVSSINRDAFQNCRSLKKIELPASINIIHGDAFNGCSALSHIYMNSTTPPTIYDTSFPDYENPTLHVPSSALTDYTRADYWKKFEKVIAIGSEPKATAEEIAALETLLSEAQTLYNNAVEGTEPGNYRPGAKAALKAVINEVSARISEDMLTEDVEDCTDLLNTAIRSFRNKQVKNDYQTDNTLAFASSLKASRGDEFQLPIEMNNVNEISGVQFDLYLPEGLMLSKDENEDFEIELSERASNQHVVSARIMDDGALRVLVTSSQNATFTGNSGTLLTLKLFPQSTMEAGDYDVELKNIVLTDPQATRYAAEDIKSVISVSTYTLGDVNNDTYIDVADLTGVVLFILENADASLVFNAADMDGNGVVEVNDYAALVNVILAQEAPAGSRMLGATEMNPNIVSLSDIKVNENGNGELMVNLISKDRNYTGLQFDLYLPEGIMLNTETAESTDRHHSVWAKKRANGYYRVICSSMMNDELSEGTVMRLQVKAASNMQGTYNVLAGNVVLSETNAQRHEAANAGAQLMIGNEATGIDQVSNLNSNNSNLYDMQGRRVNAVKKGVYMVNGKKVVVR